MERRAYSYAGMGYANPHASTQIGNGTATSTYAYDADGNLVQKTTDGTVTTYVYDYANRLIALGVSGGGTTTSPEQLSLRKKYNIQTLPMERRRYKCRNLFPSTMMTEQTRDLTEYERSVVKALLDTKFPGSEVLSRQFDHATARLMKTDDNYGSIVITTKSLEPANIEVRVPVTALTRDDSGGPVEILLHVVNGFIHELEFVRLDGKPMVGLPRLDILQAHIETEATPNKTRQIPPAQ